jgi:NDP-sugar pyrophosphorylase family protein
MKEDNKTAAVVLAAGKGTRIGQHLPKALYPIVGKPMLYYCLDLIKRIPVYKTYVVVGYKATDVKASIRNEENINYVYQKEQLGTAHAASLAVEKLPASINKVIIFNGDDSAFFEISTIREFLKNHNNSLTKISFMSCVVDNSTGLGRVVRDSSGKVTRIIEEKDLTDEEKKIKEVNVGCYIFDKEWLKKTIKKISKSSSGEYYITDLISIALKENNKINNFVLKSTKEWRGINDQGELKEANIDMLVRLEKQKEPTVFVFDIDNTLLDTDSVKKYVSNNLVKRLIKTDLLKIFWDEYEDCRKKLGHVSIPEFSDSFAEKTQQSRFSEEIREMFYTIPFNKFIFAGVNDLMEYIDPKGEIVILTDGDLVYQPMKIKNLEISKYLDEMFVFEHKSEFPEVIDKIYRGRRKIIVDDKITNLESLKSGVENSIAIHIKQGIYKNLLPENPNFKADFVANDIYDLTEFIKKLY